MSVYHGVNAQKYPPEKVEGPRVSVNNNCSVADYRMCKDLPVRWQSGIKNPSRGIHVWPEPDPVKTKLTLVKNSGKKLLQYQEKPWTILVQNLSASGRRKIIATGHLDIADYITEEPSTHDITVTLRAATKNVVTGSLEFSLSSVLLENGIPRHKDKEILDEILQDAVKSRKQSLLKTTISNGSAAPKTEKKNIAPAPPLSFKTRPAPPPRLPAKTRPAPPPPLPRKSRPAPPPPLPVKSRPAPPPPKPASSQSTSSKPRPPRPPPPSQPKQDVKVKNTLKHTEEKAANDGKRLRGLKRKVKYPKELNPFGSSSEDSLPYSVQTSKCGLGQEHGNEPEVKSSSGRRKRNRRKKKEDKYPKEFNPFGEESSGDEEGSLSSESESHPCKERPEKDSKVIDGPGTCKDLDDRDGKGRETNNGNVIVSKNDSSVTEQGGAVLLETSLVQDEPALEKAKPNVPVNTMNELEQGDGEELSKQKEGIDGHCSTPDDGPGTCKDRDEGDDKDKETNDGDAIVAKKDSSDIEQGGAVLLETSLVQDEPYELEQGSGEESSKQKKGIDGHCITPDDLALSTEQPNELEEDKSSERKDRDSALCSVSDECVQQTAKSFSPSVVKGELEEDNGEESLERKEGGDDPCSNSDDPILNGKKPSDPVVGIKKVEEPKDEESSQEQEGEDGLCSTADEPVLKRAKPYVPVIPVEELQGAKYEEAARQQEGDDVLCSTLDEPVLKRAKTYVPVIPVDELEPQEEDNDLCNTPGKPVTKRSRPYVAVAVDEERVEDQGENSEAPDPIQEKQRENGKAASLDSQHCIELSMYAQEQIAILCEEIASLEKVSIKLEMELLQAMKTKDCEEELDGLTQDWLTLTKYRDELIERKQDLEILDKQGNFDDCCKIIRKELRFLLELEDPV
ncbi:hypothetical protein ACROYT_G026398 [Oculina patagonica]